MSQNHLSVSMFRLRDFVQVLSALLLDMCGLDLIGRERSDPYCGCTRLQSDAQKDGAATARPSVLVRRTTRIGVPVPLSSSRSFTTAMMHQPSAATVGGPLGLLPAPSRRTRTTAEQLLPTPDATGSASDQLGEVRIFTHYSMLPTGCDAHVPHR